MTRTVSPCPQADPLFGAEHDSRQHHRLWRPDGIADWLLWCTVDGEVEVCHGDERITMDAGAWCLIPPRLAHDYGTIDGGQPHWHVAWMVFRSRAAWRPLLDWPDTFEGIRYQVPVDPAAGDAALAALRESILLHESGWPGSTALASNRLEACLLWLSAGADEDAWDPRVRVVVETVLDHLDRPFDLSELAAHAELSVPQLSRLFNRDLGMSPARWVQQQRLERAKVLLDNGAAVMAVVARQCGFSDANYFGRCFKAHYGMSPGRYRTDRD